MTNLRIEKIVPNESFADCWKMLCVNDGTLTVTKDNTVYNLTHGQAVFVSENEFYYICNTADYYELSFLGDGVFLEDINNKIISLDENEIELVKKIIGLNEVKESVLATEQGLTMLKLLILLCCEKEAIKPSKDKNAAVFTLAANVLKENIKNNISVSELSVRLNLSLSNLKRLFLKYTGIGVHEYYNILKISYAKELLREGKSVTATAELSGFANQAYFSSAFKRVTGKTPKEYCLAKPKEAKATVKRKANKKADMPSYLL